MFNSCSYPCTVIDVLAEVGNEVVINILVKGLSIGEVSDTLTETLANELDVAMVDGVDMLDGDSIILVGADITIVSGFVVSLSYSVEVLPGTGPGTKSLGPRLDVLADVNNIGVVSGIGVDVWTGVDANVLPVVMTVLGVIAVSALLG